MLLIFESGVCFPYVLSSILKQKPAAATFYCEGLGLTIHHINSNNFEDENQIPGIGLFILLCLKHKNIGSEYKHIFWRLGFV